jgi:glycerol-3-phosphate acyltransferase PlsY
MDIFIAFLFLLEGYFLGSIPSAVWIGILFFGKDVRQFGSGNAGATNTFRVLGAGAGTVVLTADILKGFLAVKIPLWLHIHSPIGALSDTDFGLLCGCMALLGHLYPLYANFRGGKGVATALGIMLAVAPESSGLTFLFFLLVWLSSGYVSLASVTSGLFFAFIYFFLFKTDSGLLSVLVLIIPLLLIYTHRINIRKLLKGAETKTSPFLKRKKEMK